MTTAGFDSDFASGNEHAEALMEHLAVVPASSSASLRRSVETLQQRGSGGALVVVLAAVTAEDLALVSSLRARFGSLTVVHLDASAWDPTAPVGPVLSTAVLRVARDTPFPAAWNAYVRATSGRGTRLGARR
jgi:hypothetical protein